MVRSVLRTPGVCGGGVEEEAPVRRLLRGSVHSSFPPHPPLHAFSRSGEYVRSRFNCCEHFGFRLTLFVGQTRFGSFGFRRPDHGSSRFPSYPWF